MTVSLYVFPTLLREFQRTHPQSEIKIWAGATDRCLAAIRAGTADCGLLTLPIESPDLVTVPAMEEELLLVTSPTHPLARKRRVVPDDLRGQHFVLFESGSNTRRSLDEFFVREKIDPKIVMETENVEIIKALVRTNVGITIISFQSVAREFASHQLFCTRITGASLMRRTGWVYAKANRVPRAVQEVLACFERIRPRLKLTPSGGRPAQGRRGAGHRAAGRRRVAAAGDRPHPPDASFGCPLSMSVRPRGQRLECRMPERVITLAISDADWKALRAVQPNQWTG